MNYHILSRRDFIKQGMKASLGTLIVGVVPQAFAADQSFRPSAFIEISPRGPIIFNLHRSEMGQGIRTTCAMILAEELRVPWESLTFQQAEADEKYGDQNTDGSKSVKTLWDPLRLAGAAAREVLLKAAASHWQVNIKQLYADSGYIIDVNTGKKVRYQELAPLASGMSVPEQPTLLSKPGHFRGIGKSRKSIDIEDMVTGRAKYGVDTIKDQMIFATIVRSPTVEGELESFDRKAVQKAKGVIACFPLDAFGPSINTNESIAIVAQSTWSALQARNLVKARWDRDKALESSIKHKTSMLKEVSESCSEEDEFGDFEEALEQSKQHIKADYFTPYLAQAPMEPPNATCQFKNNRLFIWAPTQDPLRAKKAVAEALDLDEDQITLKVTLLGGGFGRKAQPDFIVEAALIAQRVKPKPVKLIWTREDDLRHSTFHATAAQHLEATFDTNGQVSGLLHRTAFPSIVPLFTNFYFFGPASFELDMGFSNMPYKIPNRLQEKAKVSTSLRIGWFRAVCNVFHAFAIESFMDEIAKVEGSDPVEIRIRHLKSDKPKPNYSSYDFNPLRMIRVIEDISAAAKQPKDKERYLGFACHYSFHSYVACSIELSKQPDGLKIEKICLTADCGLVVNPDSAHAQLEGAAIFGLSLALYGKISVTNGVVDQSNFDNYPVLRIHEAPEIHTRFITNTERPTGLGEPGVPPVAPALCNAIFSATGERVRELPIGPERFTS